MRVGLQATAVGFVVGNPDASQEAIEEKLAALVQANPVFTTTDS
jgi:hypothetical protein